MDMFFFPQDELKRRQAMKMFEIILEKNGLELIGWRVVPTVPEVLGQKALDKMPYIMQAFIKKPADVEKGLARLTVCSMWQEESLNRVMKTPMWYHVPAVPLCTKVCFW